MKNKFTKEITDRFQEAMFDIIKKNKMSGGEIDSVKAFAESLNQLPQNFSKYSRKNQHVSIAIIESACRKYKISPNYLVLGMGEMYLASDIAGKANALEERVKRLERLLSAEPKKLKRV